MEEGRRRVEREGGRERKREKIKKKRQSIQGRREPRRMGGEKKEKMEKRSNGEWGKIFRYHIVGNVRRCKFSRKCKNAVNFNFHFFSTSAQIIIDHAN